MAVSIEFLEFISEQLMPLGQISSKRFFGGRGIYLDRSIIGFIIADALYFKVDDTTRPVFEAEGSTPFTYQTKSGMQSVNGYWQAPERAFDDPDALRYFARLALAVSLGAGIKKLKKRKRPNM